MSLKYIEVENFKSFAGKVMIGPFKRFTSIVGPNGSGKSNLMDAISFVLADRISHLRVKNLQELIHGTPTGIPLAKKAHVRFVYEQEDGTHIHFCRAIIGSSSEYSVDGVVMTSHEYIDHLAKIGVLAKTRNFLVYQGAVESIAMKSPRELTQLFEEISKSGDVAEEYKLRKREMMQADEDTRLYYHCKNNVNVEKKEAKQEQDKARKYCALFDDLRVAKEEMHLFLLFHNERSILDLNGKLKLASENHTEVQNRVESLDGDLRTHKKELGKLNREHHLLEKRVKAKDAEIFRLRSEYIHARESSTHQESRLKAAQISMRNATQEVSRHRDASKDFEEQLASVEQSFNDFEELLKKESMEASGLGLNEEQMQQYYLLKDEATSRKGAVGQELEKLQREQTTMKDTLDIEERKRNEMQDLIMHKKHELEEYQTRVDQLQHYLDMNRSSSEEQQGLEKDLSETVEGARHRVRELNDELRIVLHELIDVGLVRQESNRQQQRSDVLNSLQRLFPDSVYGWLVDLCEPINRKYQLALTKALGKHMVSIVVESQKVARDCILYLKEQYAEPETFLPLDLIEVPPLDKRLRDIQGAKLVFDVIRFNPPKIRQAVLFACGNTLLCDTTESAKHFAFNSTDRMRAVSLDGTLFDKSGIISGGAKDLRMKARRWNDKAVDKLKEKKEQLTVELKDNLNIQRKEADLREVQAQLHGLQMRSKFTLIDQEQMKKKLQFSLQEVSRIETVFLNFAPHLSEIQKTITCQESEIMKLNDHINQVEDEVFREFCVSAGVSNIRQFEEERVKGHLEIAKKRSEFENQKTRLVIHLEYQNARLKEEVKKLKLWEDNVKKDKDNLERLKITNIGSGMGHTEELNDFQRATIMGCHLSNKPVHQISALRELPQSTEEQEILAAEEVLRVELEELKNNTLEHKSKLKNKTQEVEEKKNNLNAEHRKYVQLQTQLMVIESKLEEKRMERHNLFQDCKMEDVRLPLKQGSLEEVSEAEASSETPGSTQRTDSIYARETLIEVDFSGLRADLKDELAMDDVKQKGEAMEKAILAEQAVLNSIAVPNMKADENFETVRAKYSMATQDFEKSRVKAKAARQAFYKVQNIRFVRFNHCLEHVATDIDVIYKKLTQNLGAQAFLGPQNPEEPFLGGIEYNCVAPGKSFQPMENLSGGEKTIAALALLFALQSYKPSPFFFLDEVDAALDNTNIGKVTKYIQDQARENVQTIVISLKEEFSSKSDALIGVYPEVVDSVVRSRVLTFDLSPYPSSHPN
uniref:structural maintenance of chromosomes protein 1A-like n=1 Tax=Myxine glutinosa TaxID=7769 RepID=UPI00358FC219